MEKIISLPFKYDESVFYTLVRVSKNSTDCFELKVTIMNDELQTKFHGSHIYIVKDGQIKIDIPEESEEVAKLKLQIGEVLNSYLAVHPLYTE